MQTATSTSTNTDAAAPATRTELLEPGSPDGPGSLGGPGSPDGPGSLGGPGSLDGPGSLNGPDSSAQCVYRHVDNTVLFLPTIILLLTVARVEYYLSLPNTRMLYLCS